MTPPRRPRRSKPVRGADAGLPPEPPLTTADRLGAPEPREREAPLPDLPDIDPLLRAAGESLRESLSGRLSGDLSGHPRAGLDSNAFATAWGEYWSKLLAAPTRHLELAQRAVELATDTLAFAQRAAAEAAQAAQAANATAPNHHANDLVPGLSPHAEAPLADARYADAAWNQFPYNVLARFHQNFTALARTATDAIPGLDDRQRDLVDFGLRMSSDASSPANALLTNPLLLEQTRRENGANLKRGWEYFLEDLDRQQQGRPPAGADDYVAGKTVACTPGRVVLRNALVELIQYSPTTPTVHAAPVFIVPAWIMKYYILDLSPHNSLVRWLVAQGHTVFCLSWKNPTPADRELGMDDYVRLGIEEPLAAVCSIVPDVPVQTVGYCIGGTLLAIGAALLAGRGDMRIGSLTLFAAQTDFSEPGELSLFIRPGQLAVLEAMMAQRGVLESHQMAAAFQWLRPQDLIFQPAVNAYLRGQREPMVDLMAWNADGTRMPARMHGEYLRRLYLENQLANDRYTVGDQVLHLADIRVPAFLVGTEADHVAPWRSVYKADRLLGSESVTFLLTSAGHNGGIVSGPVNPKRRHRARTRTVDESRLTPEEWLAQVPVQAGSWWPHWEHWLAAHGGAMVKPPKMGSADYPAVADAPGHYVHAR